MWSSMLMFLLLKIGFRHVIVSNIHIVTIAEAFIMVNDKQTLVLSSLFNNLFLQ